MNIPELLTPLRLEGVGVAVLCGLIVGLERQLSGKPTGIRTSSLICLGTYIFVAVGGLLPSGAADPSRIVGQVVTGIGFLGAGVILTRQGVVVGVTSAAVIWVLAGVGVLIGFERYASAMLVSVLTVGILLGVGLLERSFLALSKGIYTRLSSRRAKGGSEEDT